MNLCKFLNVSVQPGGAMGKGIDSSRYKDLRKRVYTQSCPTLCNPVDYSPSGSSVPNFPGKNTGLGYHFLLQRIFLTQGSSQHLLHCRWILHHCWACTKAERHKKSSSHKVFCLHSGVCVCVCVCVSTSVCVTYSEKEGRSRRLRWEGDI